MKRYSKKWDTVYEIKNWDLYKNWALYRQLMHGAFSIFPWDKLVLYTLKKKKEIIDLFPDDLVLKNWTDINSNNRQVFTS